MRWLFVGGGNMASSLVGGLIASGATPVSVAVVEPADATRAQLHTRFGVVTASDLPSLINAHESWRDAADGKLGIVLAVKPNIAQLACESLSKIGFEGNPAVLSVAAGVRSDTLSKWLGTRTAWSVMRCMPNTPALLGKGASALHAGGATTAHRKAALELLNAVGTAVALDSEAEIDAVTALSGSGPAYVFRLAELMIENAEALGLKPEDARQLGIATIEGAAAMLVSGEDDPSTLRQKVTSPGGTTAAALKHFSTNGLDTCIRGGMIAARDRAQQLGAEIDDSSPTHS